MRQACSVTRDTSLHDVLSTLPLERSPAVDYSAYSVSPCFLSVSSGTCRLLSGTYTVLNGMYNIPVYLECSAVSIAGTMYIPVGTVNDFL